MTTLFISPHKKFIYIFISFTIVILILTIIGLIQFFYRATIIVTSKRYPVEINLTETTSSQILEETVMGEKTFAPATIATLEDFATGEVTIINNSTQSQSLVVNTRLLSKENKLFRLTEKINIPPRQRVKAMVRSDKTGAEYEIGPTTFTIPGLSQILQTKIYAESKETMAGGFKKVGIITQKDIDEAINTLKNNLQEQALAVLEKRNTNPNLRLAHRSEINSLTVDAKANEEKDKFLVKLEIKTTAVLINEENLLKIITQKLSEQITIGQKLLSVDPSTFSYKLKSYNTEQQNAIIEMYISGQSILSENNNSLAKVYLISKTKGEIESYLKTVEGIENLKIDFSPFFIKKTPNTEERIYLKTI